MFRLSEADKRIAKMAALITLTDNAGRILADRAEKGVSKHRALEALMGIEWTSDLTRASGSGRINRLPQSMRGENFSTWGYEPFRDMLIYAGDSHSPAIHAQWIVWRRWITRFHLSEITDIKSCMGSVARFATRNIRTPNCLSRIPFNQQTAAGWEIPHTDMMVWIWQATRQDLVGFPCALNWSDLTSHPDFQDLIARLRTNSVGSTGI